MLPDLPVDTDHQRIAKALSWIAAFVIIVTGYFRYLDTPETPLFLSFRVVVVLTILAFGVASQHVKTQNQFDLLGTALIFVINFWILSVVWNFSFEAEATIGMIVVIFLSQTLLAPTKYDTFYVIAILAFASIGLWTSAEVEINRIWLMLSLALTMITTKLVSNKWAKDRNELQENQQKLIDAREEAELAAKSRSQFMANMSHEVRTPLNGIIGTMSLMESTELDDEQTSMVQTVLDSSELLLSLINDILDFSKLDVTQISLEETETDLEQMFSQCIELLLPFAGNKDLRLFLDLDPGAFVRVRFDSKKLKQVVVNLLNNAIKFTDEGEVVLRVSLEKSQSKNTPNSLVCAVSDTGVGISADQLEHIFEEFSQGDASATRRHGGSGLGLAISRKIVKAMGGDISVSSSVGEGSTFEFSIPVAGSKSASDSWLEENAFKDRSVATVSESTKLRSIYSQYFQHWGMNDSGFADLDSLLAMLEAERAAGALPELLLIDSLCIPFMVSELTEKLRRLYGDKEPAIILLASKRSSNSRDGNVMVLSQPVRPSLLFKVCADIFEKPKLEQAQPQENLLELPERRSFANLRVLVVDDNIVNQQVVCSILKRLGYSYEVAANGLEAMVQLSVDSYDVVLMDLQMPEMDGLTATRKIRQLSINQPYIAAVTANAYEKDREACKVAGMDGFLAKPMRLEDLKSILESAEKALIKKPANGIGSEVSSIAAGKAQGSE